MWVHCPRLSPLRIKPSNGGTDYQYKYHLQIINISSPYCAISEPFNMRLECESILFIKWRYKPHIFETFQIVFPTASLICKVVSSGDKRKNNWAWSFDRFTSIRALALKLWIYFCDVLHETKPINAHKLSRVHSMNWKSTLTCLYLSRLQLSMLQYTFILHKQFSQFN